MIINEYEKNELLFNIAFVESADAADVVAFRGRLALMQGEVGDATGHRKPPAVLMEQAVVLSKGDKLQLLAGSLDRLEDLPTLVEMYKADFAPDMLAIIYVVNLTKPAQVELEGINFSLIPMREGVAWNELMDEAGLEKQDLKKMSSGQKVATLYADLKGYKPKGEKMSLEQALGLTADIKRVERGAL